MTFWEGEKLDVNFLEMPQKGDCSNRILFISCNGLCNRVLDMRKMAVLIVIFSSFWSIFKILLFMFNGIF